MSEQQLSRNGGADKIIFWSAPPFQDGFRRRFSCSQRCAYMDNWMCVVVIGVQVIFNLFGSVAPISGSKQDSMNGPPGYEQE